MPSKKKKYNARFPAVSTDFEQPFVKYVVKLILFLGAYKKNYANRWGSGKSSPSSTSYNLYPFKT